MKPFQFCVGLCLLGLIQWTWAPSAYAQEPNNAPAKDSIVFDNGNASEAPIISNDLGPVKRIQSKAKQYSPRKAGLYSAILPGLGQAYNKKYWKMPIVYGGFIGLSWFIKLNNDDHNQFREALFNDIIGNNQTETVILNRKNDSIPVSEANLRRLIDQRRRDRDYFIILSGIFYLLNIADAHIDAHLKEFDLNEDLQVKLQPKISSGPLGAPLAGLALTFNFK